MDNVLTAFSLNESEEKERRSAREKKTAFQVDFMGGFCPSQE